MAEKYIVLGRKVKGGIELLAHPDVNPAKQKEILAENHDNAKFSEVQMFRLEPHSRAFHPAPKPGVEAK